MQKYKIIDIRENTKDRYIYYRDYNSVIGNTGHFEDDKFIFDKGIIFSNCGNQLISSDNVRGVSDCLILKEITE